ncbi:MAG: glutamate--tRNA ligase, partial [Candidatus Heimdallarchaeota archaeon]
RKIRDLIKRGIIQEWDDFRLSTLSGMRRRGIVPETIKQIAFEMQLSKVQAELDLSVLLAINRKIVDDIAKRLFAVLNPIELHVDNLPGTEVTLTYHPKNKDLGNRHIPYDNDFYIGYADLDILKPGALIRLKDLCNIRINEIKTYKNGRNVVKSSYDENPSLDLPKIQWIPKNNHMKLIVNIPGPLYIEEKINPNSLRREKGYIEKAALKFQEGDLIQLERIGFGRIDSISQNEIIVNMTE